MLEISDDYAIRLGGQVEFAEKHIKNIKTSYDQVKIHDDIIETLFIRVELQLCEAKNAYAYFLENRDTDSVDDILNSIEKICLLSSQIIHRIDEIIRASELIK